jgi:membrane fusion protein (multidrug efflux system)
MTKRFIVAIILLALVGGGLVGFNMFRDRMIADIFANMPVQPANVSTVTAEAGTWEPTIDAIGTVNASQGVDLTVEAAGIVKEIAFESNATVEEGQLLVRLDDVVQRADLEAAQTRLELDRLNLERARELAQRGVAASANLDESEAAFQVSTAEVARAQAVLEQRTLVAPFHGTIGLPRVDLGQYLAPGTRVATLQDLETMRVDFSLPEQRLADVEIGQALTVRIEGLDAEYPGTITGVDPRVDPASRLFAVRATIDNTGGGLTPGQFVRIEVAQPAEPDIVALPQSAVTSSLYGDFVYVVRPSEENAEQLEARQVFVELGRRAEGRVEIRSGVAPGDRVVTAGQNRLFSGMPVTLEEGTGGPEAGGLAGESALQREAAAR